MTGNKVAGNAITNNGGPGVAVIGPRSTGNTISADTIAGNAGPPIDEGSLTHPCFRGSRHHHNRER